MADVLLIARQSAGRKDFPTTNGRPKSGLPMQFPAPVPVWRRLPGRDRQETSLSRLDRAPVMPITAVEPPSPSLGVGRGASFALNARLLLMAYQIRRRWPDWHEEPIPSGARAAADSRENHPSTRDDLPPANALRPDPTWPRTERRIPAPPLLVFRESCPRMAPPFAPEACPWGGRQFGPASGRRAIHTADRRPSAIDWPAIHPVVQAA